jgi:leucyl-tRNA synthetase
VWKNFCGQLESDRESVFVENLDKQKYWLPVDVYIGGDEHNTLHLLYSRFIMNFLYDMGVVSVPEPYDKRVSHGVILGPDGSRMSKSRGNVIVPEDYSQKYGVDVLRTYMMFMGPFEATMAWNEKTLVGVARFLNKMEKMMEQKLSKGGETGAKEASWINKTIEDISRDLAQFKFNTPVAKLMELVNNLQKEEMIVNRQDLGKILAMLAVYAPYLAEELWVKLNLSTDSVHQSPWPLADASKIVNDILVVPVCINGKIRGEIKLAVEEVDQEEEIKRKAMEAEAVFKYLAGREVKRAVYVPGKMINLVV